MSPSGSGERLPPMLCAAMAAQFAAGGAVIPFITLLLRDRGLDFRQISLVFTASSATLLVFPFVWGMLADRYLPLNRLFTLLNVLGCAALVGLASARSFPVLLLTYTAYFACFNPTLYLINALSFQHLRNPQGQFGRLRAWGSVGWIVPFLPIALWLARGRADGLDVVLWMGISCSAAMALLSLWLPFTAPGARARGQGAQTGQAAYGNALKRLVSDRNYLVVLLSMFLIAGSYSLLTYYSPALLADLGIPRPWIGPIQAIGVVCEILLFQWQPRLLRRWNYAPVLLLGCMALLVRHLIFAIASDPWVLCASYFFAGAVIVFFHQGVAILVNAVAAHEVRATAQTSLLFFGQGMGPLVANAAVGYLTPETGENRLRLVFVFAAVLSGLAAVVIAWRGRELNRVGRIAGT